MAPEAHVLVLNVPRGVLTVPDHPKMADLPDTSGMAGAVDVAAFHRLFETHGDRMKSVAVQLLGNRSDAEDAVQDAFLKACRGAGSFRGQSAFSTWVYRILVNACHDLRRRRRSREESLTPDDTPLETAHRPSETGRERLRVELRQAIDGLQPMNRSVFVLFEVEGFSHREIAEILGIPEGTSRNLLFRTKRELQEILIRRRNALAGGLS